MKKPFPAFSASLAVIWCVLLLCPVASGGDWPQILGPDRNGKATGEKLAATWPASGPVRLWSAKLGSGYAGPAVVGDRVIVFHRTAEGEVVEALDAKTGKPQWKAGFAASYRGTFNPDSGPRCVPLVADGSVYAFGAAGDFHCIALHSGKPRWSRSLYLDYKAPDGYFGAGSTPILVGGTLIVNVGGRGAGLVGLSPETGKTLWKVSDEEASYSSPIAIQRAGKQQAVFVTRYNCVLVEPTAGKVQTLFPFGMRGATVNAANPLAIGDKLFVTASYNIGAQLAALEGTAARLIWANDDTLSSQYATPVEHNGFLYGTHGREDIGVAELRCVEAATGKVRWSKPGYGVANIILADEKLVIVGAAGRVALAKANPAKYEELASFDMSEEVSRALPALCNGRLYVRTGMGGGQLHCFSVGQ